jgi:hypothetical protein
MPIECPASHGKGVRKDPDWPSSTFCWTHPFLVQETIPLSRLRNDYDMYPSVRLLQHACRITLFTRSNCSLCTNAKQTLSAVWDARPFEYKEIDVMKAEEKKWRDLYEFDTPVCEFIHYIAKIVLT